MTAAVLAAAAPAGSYPGGDAAWSVISERDGPDGPVTAMRAAMRAPEAGAPGPAAAAAPVLMIECLPPSRRFSIHVVPGAPADAARLETAALTARVDAGPPEAVEMRRGTGSLYREGEAALAFAARLVGHDRVRLSLAGETGEFPLQGFDAAAAALAEACALQIRAHRPD